MHCTSCGTLLTAGVRTCPTCSAPVLSMPTPVQAPGRTTPFYDEYIPFTDQGTPPVPEQEAPSAPPSVPSAQSMQTTETETSPPPVVTPPSPRRTPLLILTTTTSIISVLVIIVLVFLLVHTNAGNRTAQTPTNDPQTLYNEVTSRTPAIDDGFSSKNSSNWTSGITGNGKCTVTGDTLHTTAPQGTGESCASKNINVSNFACQVQTTLTKGDTVGLIFRANPTSSKAYLLELSPNQGTYLLGTGQSGTSNFQILAQGATNTFNTASGQSNLLTIIAQGSIFYLYVNKHFTISTSDTSSSSGLIDIVSSGNLTNVPVDATFSHFQLWKL